jgi:hypothetical protein
MANLKFDLFAGVGGIVIITMLLFLVKVNEIKKAVLDKVEENARKSISYRTTSFFVQFPCSSFPYTIFSADNILHHLFSINEAHRSYSRHALAGASDHHGNEMPFCKV